MAREQGGRNESKEVAYKGGSRKHSNVAQTRGKGEGKKVRQAE
jgi:hypothetical protein